MRRSAQHKNFFILSIRVLCLKMLRFSNIPTFPSFIVNIQGFIIPSWIFGRYHDAPTE
ncbi:hypothetical protein M758_6G062700 [Ceratodon purpureus]|nr:hypothetical protein M758_6G062700 [Ceratodon purpureus]